MCGFAVRPSPDICRPGAGVRVEAHIPSVQTSKLRTKLTNPLMNHVLCFCPDNSYLHKSLQGQIQIWTPPAPGSSALGHMEGGHGPQSATISSHPSLLLTTGPPCSYPSLQAKPWPHSTFPCNPSGRWCVPRRPPGLQTPWERGLYKVWGSGRGCLARV